MRLLLTYIVLKKLVGVREVWDIGDIWLIVGRITEVLLYEHLL